VIVEEMDEAQSVTCHAAECFHAPKQNSKGIPEPVRVQAVQFLSRRMSSHWLNGKPMGINKRDTWGNRVKGDIRSEKPPKHCQEALGRANAASHHQ
jgi:hypothetical protein